MSIKDFKLSAVDASAGLSLGEYADKIVDSKAYGYCGGGVQCAGGGGMCGGGVNCAGGGGMCGGGVNCAGS